MMDEPARDRLQPSLLDRLTDDEPTKQRESRDKRVLSMLRLRAAVLRDLTWLLNTDAIGSTGAFDDHPQVKTSVLNYGLPDYTGSTVSSMSVEEMERWIAEAIRTFEPRIIGDSVQVVAGVVTSEGHNRMTFTIEGELWAEPVPERLYLRTEVDLESGRCAVKGVDARGTA